MGKLTIKEIKKLVLESSNYNPYSGELSDRLHILSAISLSKLFKEFADGGYMDEAMNIPSSDWIKVIKRIRIYVKQKQGR